MSLSVYTMTEDDLTREANKVLAETATALQKENYVTEAALNAFLESHAVIVVRKGLFAKILEKLMGLPDDGFRYYIVKVIK